MAYRFRLHPEPAQKATMLRHCADARFVWNIALEQSNFYRAGLRAPGHTERCRQLTEAREGSWLAEGSRHVQLASLRDFDQALRNWWGGSHHRPTWRRKGVHEGFAIRDVRVWKLNGRWAEVTVPKAGRVRFRLSRPMPVEHGMGRVTLDRAGRWHVSFSTPQPAIERKPTGAVVGLDRGVAVTLATSGGALLHCPVPTKGEKARRARLQRHHTRQVKGSNRKERTRLAIAKLTARHADRRKDWVEKTSTALVRDYDAIALEDLRVHQMMRSPRGTTEAPGRGVRQKAGLNRAIAEQGWSMLARRIADKAAASGVTVILVPPRGTSQTCHACGHRTAENRLTQASFLCLSCGHEANADVNAALNIRAAGLAVLARGGADNGRADEPRTPEAEPAHAV